MNLTTKVSKKFLGRAIASYQTPPQSVKKNLIPTPHQPYGLRPLDALLLSDNLHAAYSVKLQIVAFICCRILESWKDWRKINNSIA